MSNVISLRNTGGFTRMDNSLMESLAKVDLPAREFRVLFAVSRQTIGYQVEAKRLTADEIGALTNMRRDVVSKAISHLLERRILFRIGGSRGELGVAPANEWVFFEEKENSLSETKSSHSDNVVSLGAQSSETKSAQTLLYTKKEDLPLETVPSEQISAPQGADHPPVEKSNGVSFDGEEFQVEPELIAKWAGVYAPVDVETEVSRAAVWAAANPRKVKKDWRRFLVNWMAKRAAKAVSEAGVPVDKIIDLYHRTCPNLPTVAVAGDKVLRALIVERWNESDKHQASPLWKTIFDRANRMTQVWYRGANVVPRLEVICSRAVFRQLEEQA
ncbi:phage replication protein [Pseudomonas sp. AU11447]|uniref:replication protein n=1 Tax=Pseudomonas sp. AU11447 TaxID=1843184 RepID=UPI0007EE1BBC|nr:replication protein [Pseudomonas sp. AU11447]OBY91158.1 phage replication protein [Pseudomonas sp. AU11447]